MEVLSFQFQIRKKERKRIMRIRDGFNFFCFCGNLSNDDIIFTERLGLKTGVENDIFLSEVGSGLGETGSTPPSRIFRSTPHPPELVSLIQYSVSALALASTSTDGFFKQLQVWSFTANWLMGMSRLRPGQIT